MHYVIKNHRNLYIKLNKNGKVTTCNEQDKDLFEYSKAKNIVACLPKTLRRLNFKVEFASDSDIKNKEGKCIKKEDYVVSDNIIRWIEKFGVCSDVLDEAKQREKSLLLELNKVDMEFLDILHIIEIEKSKDLYGGWKEYKHIKDNRERRREIKDELLIIKNVLKEIDPSQLHRKRVERAINGLCSRKYKLKVVEEEDDEM